jgi:uncharacterized phage protein gp47/JayE
MARPDERRFILFPRGHVRDNIILAALRAGLRELVNPDTGALFTEDEIAVITQEGSRYYLEAEAIDIYGQATQSRAAWFVDQLFPRRASSAYLTSVHQALWLPEGKLAAVGGSGDVTARGDSGVIWVGSSELGDPAAHFCRDSRLKRYQVLVTETTPASGEVTLTLRGIDGGDSTNPVAGDVLTWENPPANGEPTCTVAENFSGGINAETDAEFAVRLEEAQRLHPGSGNRGHFRAWAKAASAAVEVAFVYACALNAGSVIVAIIQKRGSAVGPLARIPSTGTMVDVTAYLTPPASPVVPGNVNLVAVPAVSQPTDVALRVGLERGADGGWSDLSPWPRASTAYPFAAITTLTSQTSFRITTDEAPTFALPASGSTLPALMVWNESTSRFEQLSVSAVSLFAANEYTITLSAAPSFTIALGDVISPFTEQHLLVALSAEGHFDSLGTGEVVSLTSSLVAHRAYRFPRTAQEYPAKLNARIVSDMLEALGGSAGDVELISPTSTTTPTVPVSPSTGPSLITLGKLGIYDVEE